MTEQQKGTAYHLFLKKMLSAWVKGEIISLEEQVKLLGEGLSVDDKIEMFVAFKDMKQSMERALVKAKENRDKIIAEKRKEFPDLDMVEIEKIADREIPIIFTDRTNLAVGKIDFFPFNKTNNE